MAEDNKASDVSTDVPKSVQLDGLVLLKIIKHCKESAPEVASGTLLGLNVNGVLEVTHSFALPPASPEEDNEKFQIEMMKYMRQVNVDNNTVGWYQSVMSMGDFFTPQLIEAQYNYQRNIPSSVVVAYDPFRTTNGRLVISAYRLTSNFMKLCGKKFSADQFTNINELSDGILEEVPIKIHNSYLVHAFLYELRETKKMSCDFDRLNLAVSSSLEKSMDDLSSLIDAHAQEQNKYQFYLRQDARVKQQRDNHLAKWRAENEQRVADGKEPLPEEDLSKNPAFRLPNKPNRLEAVLTSRQIAYHSSQINTAANQAFHKLYLLQALHRESSE